MVFQKKKSPGNGLIMGSQKKRKGEITGFNGKRGMVPWAFKRKSEKSRKREWGLQKKR